ncbi:MAG: hypothetical protein SWK90_20265 [Chloroflexota bacterium]|nr:hypothetical protein [Chloroflexota bacterium]
MPKTCCPECDAVIRVDYPRDGARVKCPECGVELEVIEADPFEVDYFYEGWDDEEEYERDTQ